MAVPGSWKANPGRQGPASLQRFNGETQPASDGLRISREMRAVLPCLGLFLALCLPLHAAEVPTSFAPPESLVLDHVPPVPADLPERAGRYTEFRAATLADWHPLRREMLVLTRFADTQQVHLVKNPGGARTQLTFFPDRVESATFEPTRGDFFVFSKGTGGAEFFQNYRYDLATGDVTLLTDGRSRHSAPVFSHDGRRLAYTSTRRNGTDTDLYVQDPLDPQSAKLLAEVKGGGWQVEDWSPDDARLLVLEYVSVNETYLWLFDAQTGERIELTPRIPGEEKIARTKARFTKDRKGIFLLTDNQSDVPRLVYYDLETKQPYYFEASTNAAWGVEDFELANDGHKIALSVNVDGASKVYLLTYERRSPREFTMRQIGAVNYKESVITGVAWHPSAREIGFSLTNSASPSDVFSSVLLSDRIEIEERWTQSETGGLNASRFVAPQLVRWKSFDGLDVSGFLYAPDAAKHPGKRPVIVNIHGGPEGQYRPGYLGRNNYLLNELGCAIIFPNVRGSAGYGKTFLTLDNGLKRENSYKDIGALLDWIKQQPNLDADRVMLTGGSYGGHMTLACATLYADRIRCAVDIVGMSNLKTFLERTESYRRDLRRAEYGDERDPATAEFMERTAPLNNAAKITKPLFVIQGANDPRVPRAEAEQIVATLKKQGTPVPYLLAKDEGHGFARKKNADFQFYATVEFIRRYLLGDGGGEPVN